MMRKLLVRIGVDDKSLQRGLSGATSRLQKFAVVARTIALGVAGAFVAMSAAAVAGISKVTAAADKFAKSAQKIGIGVVELQRLTHAAGLSGVSFEQLSSGITSANRRLAAMASGAGGETKKALDALGISIKNTDGTLKSVTQITSEVSDKFATYKDGVNKSALAMAIFGKSGANMIPMLNQGSEAIEEQKSELDALGATMSGRLAKASEVLNDNISKLGTAFFGIFVQIAEYVVPILANVTTAIVNWVKENKVAIRIGEQYTNTLKVMVRGINLVRNSFTAAYEDIVFLWKNMGDVVGSAVIGSANASIRAINALVAGAKGGLNSLIESANSVLPRVLQINPFDVDGNKIAEMVNPYAKRLEKPLAEHAKRIGTIMARDMFASMDEKGAELAKDSILANAPGLAGGSAASGGAASGGEDEKEKQMREKLARRVEIMRESFLNEQDVAANHYARDLEMLNNALENKVITEQDHMDLRESLEKKHQDKLDAIRNASNNAMLGGVNDAMSGVSSLLQSYGDKHLKKVKALAISQALIAAYTGAAEALKLPFPANLGAFATVLGKGLAAVASIRSISSSGGGGGGGGRGGGGGGGGGGRGGGVETAAGGSQTLFVEGVDQSALFNGPTTQELAKRLLDFQRDGGEVVFR